MKQIYPDEGLVPLLKAMVGTDVKLALFILPAAPTQATILSGFTRPAYTGYADISVPIASFTLQGVVSHVGILQALPVAFVPGSITGETIYGYFMYDTADTYLIAFALFDVPYVVDSLTPILVTPVLSDLSQQVP